MRKRLILVDIETPQEFIAAKDAAERFKKTDAFNFRSDDDKSPLINMEYQTQDGRILSLMVGAEGLDSIVYKHDMSKK